MRADSNEENKTTRVASGSSCYRGNRRISSPFPSKEVSSNSFFRCIQKAPLLVQKRRESSNYSNEQHPKIASALFNQKPLYRESRRLKLTFFLLPSRSHFYRGGYLRVYVRLQRKRCPRPFQNRTNAIPRNLPRKYTRISLRPRFFIPVFLVRIDDYSISVRLGRDERLSDFLLRRRA